MRLPTQWLGVAPFFIFALLFLILPTFNIVVGAFRNSDGQATLENIGKLVIGFNAGDEILAIGDDRIPPDAWSKRMDSFRPGEAVSVLISRRDRLRRLDATFGQEPPRQWTLEILPDPSPAQKAHLKEWVGEKR